MKKNGNSPMNTASLIERIESAEKRGISLKEIAEAAGIGYFRLHRIVRGKRPPKLDEAIQILDAIDQLAAKKSKELAALASL